MPNPTCSVPDCAGNPVARGWCGRHYQRWSKFGDPLADHSRKRGVCEVEGCEDTTEAKKLCNKHYQRLRNFGDPMIDRERPRVPCSVDECGRKPIGNGLCAGHYTRALNGRPLDDKPLRRYIITDDLAERLREYAPPGQPDACWEWTGGRNKGYGVIAVHGSKVRVAHVVAWELHHRTSLPDGMVVRHKCDNPPCVNPAHLLLGTHGDNNRDKSARDRHGHNGQGFKHLTPDEVRQIRALQEQQGVNMTEIARRFSRSRATIIRVIQRKVFDNVE